LFWRVFGLDLASLNHSFPTGHAPLARQTGLPGPPARAIADVARFPSWRVRFDSPAYGVAARAPTAGRHGTYAGGSAASGQWRTHIECAPVPTLIGSTMSMKRSLQLTLATIVAAGFASTALAQADNSNSVIAPKSSFSSWMSDYSTANRGRISREAYLQESGARWDAMDRDRQGLTTDQVNSLYGYQPAPAMQMKDTMNKSTGSTNVTK